jgi:hypothetical protein
MDAVVEEARELLATRSQRGMAKYGLPLTREDLALEDWLTHAIEEQADNLLYLIRARRKLREDR